MSLADTINNPGGIRDDGSNWMGKVGTLVAADGGQPYVKFMSKIFGIRAMIVNLFTVGVNTGMALSDYISEYVGDDSNDELGYVTGQTGISSDFTLDNITVPVLTALMQSQYRFEAGEDMSEAEYDAALLLLPESVKSKLGVPAIVKQEIEDVPFWAWIVLAVMVLIAFRFFRYLLRKLF